MIKPFLRFQSRVSYGLVLAPSEIIQPEKRFPMSIRPRQRRVFGVNQPRSKGTASNRLSHLCTRLYPYRSLLGVTHGIENFGSGSATHL